MTAPSPISYRRYQYAVAAGAVLLAAATVGAVLHRLYIPASGLAVGALILTEATLREHRRLRRRRLECEWARRRALGENPPPLNPCCLLACHSHGQAHDVHCTGSHSLATFLDHIEQQHREGA